MGARASLSLTVLAARAAMGGGARIDAARLALEEKLEAERRERLTAAELEAEERARAALAS